jgi:hypothetical protein
MAAMVRTRAPGIYKRGSRYVVVYRVAGKQRKETLRTLDEARKLKAARQTDLERGEFNEQTRLTFGEYTVAWVERYHGKGRGFRESTRREYRTYLRLYILPVFGERRLSQITRVDVSKLVAWLIDPTAQAEHEAELKRREALEAERRGKRPKRYKPKDQRRREEAVRAQLTAAGGPQPTRADAAVRARRRPGRAR